MVERQEKQSRGKAYNYEECAEADENSPDDGHDPVHLVESSPPVHEEAETHKGAEQDHHDQVVLRLRGGDAVGPHARPLHAAVQAVEGDQGEDERDAGAQVHEPGHGGAEAVLALEDAGEGREEEVHGAEDECHVDGDDQQDGRPDQQLARPHQRREEHVAGRQAPGRQPGLQLGVARAGAKAGCLALQQDLGVCLANEDGGDEEDCAAEDDQDPEGPAPTQADDGEASDEWPEYLWFTSAHARKRSCWGSL